MFYNMLKNDHFWGYVEKPKKGGVPFSLVKHRCLDIGCQFAKNDDFSVFFFNCESQKNTLLQGVNTHRYMSNTLWGLLTGGHLFIAFPS